MCIRAFFMYFWFLSGFGNISPHTEGGRIFCIIYALLGIPLFGFLLAGVGDQLGTIFGKGIAKVEKMIVVRHAFYVSLPFSPSVTERRFCIKMKQSKHEHAA